ncbi:sensor histidine kinase [Alteromonas facilis]|uniref:sensor histidine kinase n=1 Tax=Alteromonas facilis TaxID=2048004 RepID=UPI000C290554|nr:histidine kinase [Alteromonas facilis]
MRWVISTSANEYYSSIQSRWFWLTNTFVWIGFLTFFSFAQSRNAKAVELAISWGDYWIMMAPWFLNFIWVTPMVFVVMHVALVEKSTRAWYQPLSTAFASLGVLFCYWTVSLIMQMLIRGEAFDAFHMRLYKVIMSTGVIDIVIYFAIFWAAIGAHYYHKAMEHRVSINQIKQELVLEQLKALRSQLNPHFLFNTLNTISSLVRLNEQDKAIEALSELSTMLRMSLDTKQDEIISLRQEMQFIDSYLAIQKLRFADKLRIDTQIDSNCLNAQIPNMLLQPLVENAVQHGSQIGGKDNVISLRIHNREGELVIFLTNHVGEQEDQRGFGIGLANTRERLQRMYKSFKLELTPVNDGVFQTLLSLPIKP